jgi:hypothetical protein
MSTGHDVTTLYRTYIALWNATTEAEQRRRLADALTPDAQLIYPVFTCRGIDEILAGLAGLHGRWPGVRFVQASGIEEHHRWLRVGWRMVRDDGSVVMEGVDVATVAEEGRLRQVIGFHDPLPPLE